MELGTQPLNNTIVQILLGGSVRLSPFCGSYTGKEREHRCDVGYVIDEGGDEDRTPYDDREKDEFVRAAEACDEVCEVIDNADFPDGCDDDEKSCQEEHSIIVHCLEGVNHALCGLLLDELPDDRDDAAHHADDTVGA